jgi:two-component system, NarL family, sensor kinase
VTLADGPGTTGASHPEVPARVPWLRLSGTQARTQPDRPVRPRTVVIQVIAGPSLVRVKLWTATGRIVYSDEPRLTGKTFPLGSDERASLARPVVHAELSNLERPENRYERGRGKLLEVYRPVWMPSGQPLLFETYSPYSLVTQRTGELWRGFAGITISSLLILVVLLLPILWRLLKRITSAQSQRYA